MIILDLMMPYVDGWKVCEEIRRSDEIPIVFLTAKGEEYDRLIGLTTGANDYITKPFNPRELVLRVNAICRLLDYRKSPMGLKQNGLINLFNSCSSYPYWTQREFNLLTNQYE